MEARIILMGNKQRMQAMLDGRHATLPNSSFYITRDTRAMPTFSTERTTVISLEHPKVDIEELHEYLREFFKLNLSCGEAVAAIVTSANGDLFLFRCSKLFKFVDSLSPYKDHDCRQPNNVRPTNFNTLKQEDFAELIFKAVIKTDLIGEAFKE